MKKLTPIKAISPLPMLLFLTSCGGKTPAQPYTVQTPVQALEASHRVQEEDHDHEHGELPTSKDSSGRQILDLSPDALRDLRLTTRKAEKRPAGDTVVAFGSLELDPNMSFAVSTPIAARVAKIAKREGERILAGEVLVELESAELARVWLSVETAKTRIAIAKSRAELAQKQRDRQAELVAAKMATVRELQEAEAELAARNAELAEADLEWRDSERKLALLGLEPAASGRSFALRALGPGVVFFREGMPGESVEAGHIFFRIANVGTLVAVARPFERDGVRIDDKASARLTLAAHPGKSFEAAFLRSGTEVDPASRTLPVYFSVANSEGLLLPGMSVTAEIRLASKETEEVVTVPLAAVQRIEREWCVFLPRGHGKFERRVISRGRDLGGEIEILGGLSSGEEVVVEGAFVLRSESTRGEDTGDEHHH